MTDQEQYIAAGRQEFAKEAGQPVMAVIEVQSNHEPTMEDLASGERNIERFETVGKLQAEMTQYQDTWAELAKSM